MTHETRKQVLVSILRKGAKIWNNWRMLNRVDRPDLRCAELSQLDLEGVNLKGAQLAYAKFFRTILDDADFSEADISHADFYSAKMRRTKLYSAKISQTNLCNVDFTEGSMGGARIVDSGFIGSHLVRANLAATEFLRVDLSDADLEDAFLYGAQLKDTKLISTKLNRASFLRAALAGVMLRDTSLTNCDFTDAYLTNCSFVNVDLSDVRGLENVKHLGPSNVSVDTIYRSGGNFPKLFLRGIGLPDTLIEYIPSLITAERTIMFHSCFISYSHKDNTFARRLYSRMRKEGLRVWYAAEDMRGGSKIHEQIFEAIEMHDKLLLVVSDHSMRSEWVATEIRRARQMELSQRRHRLFPISLVKYDRIKEWECFDADSGKDLAVELREYFILDFSGWQDPIEFETAFDRLLLALKAEGKSLT